ncbi:MAG: hypothetical protein ACTSQH_02360 [Candidatus Hodarchaeales archaeon]
MALIIYVISSDLYILRIQSTPLEFTCAFRSVIIFKFEDQTVIAYANDIALRMYSYESLSLNITTDQKLMTLMPVITISIVKVIVAIPWLSVNTVPRYVPLFSIPLELLSCSDPR